MITASGMEIITYGKPDAKRAAEILGPVIRKMWEQNQQQESNYDNSQHEPNQRQDHPATCAE